MKRMMMAAAGAMLVAGCSGGGDADADGNGEVSLNEAAKQVSAEAPKPQPGLYKASITMTGMDIPGMPAGMAGHGSGMNTTTEYCLTQEQVDQGFEEMMKEGQNGECSYERFNLDGGKLDAVMLCKTPQGDARMEMAGTTTPTSADFAATMAMDIEGVGAATMKFDAKHERIGECPAE
jgi:hypothetical protein